MAKTKTLVDPVAVFQQAVSFDFSAELLVRQSVVHFDAIASSNHTSALLPTMIPAEVMGAFAVELYIKFLIRNEKGANPPASGHDLVKYFRLLSDKLQSSVKEFFYQKGLSHTDPAVAALFAGDTTRQLHFNNDLEMARCCFERWRYHYEGVPFPGFVHWQLRCSFREFIIASDSQCKAIWENLPQIHSLATFRVR